MQLQARLRDFEARGVAVVAASADEPELARRARTSWGLRFPVLTTAAGEALDVLGIRHVAAKGGRDVAVPTLVLVDGSGRVVRSHQARQSHLRLSPDDVLRWIDADAGRAA